MVELALVRSLHINFTLHYNYTSIMAIVIIIIITSTYLQTLMSVCWIQINVIRCALTLWVATPAAVAEATSWRPTGEAVVVRPPVKHMQSLEGLAARVLSQTFSGLEYTSLLLCSNISVGDTVSVCSAVKGNPNSLSY